MTEKLFNNNEKIIVRKTLTKQVLFEHIYKGERLPADDRFLDSDKGGVFKYFSLSKVADSINNTECYYPLVEVNGTVVGIAELEKNPYQEDDFWISFISIDPKYQNNGYASMLVEDIFRFAKDHNISLTLSSFKDDGILKLEKKITELAKDTGVVINTTNK